MPMDRTSTNNFHSKSVITYLIPNGFDNLEPCKTYNILCVKVMCCLSLEILCALRNEIHDVGHWFNVECVSLKLKLLSGANIQMFQTLGGNKTTSVATGFLHTF